MSVQQIHARSKSGGGALNAVPDRRIALSWLPLEIGLLGFKHLALFACNEKRGEAVPRRIGVEFTVIGEVLKEKVGLWPADTKLHVGRADATPICFDCDLVGDTSGEPEWVSVSDSASSVVLCLPHYPDYFVTVTVFHQRGNRLAIGETSIFLSGNVIAVVVRLNSLARSTKLVPLLPNKALASGKVITLLSSVPHAVRKFLPFPAGDIEVTYPDSVEVVSLRGDGAPVLIGSRQSGETPLEGIATRLVIDGPNEEVGRGEVTVVSHRPSLDSESVDDAPPSGDSLAFDSLAGQLTGIATDDLSIARLGAYDDPKLPATANPHISVARGLPTVSFPHEVTASVPLIDLAPGTYDPTVKAFDLVGDEPTSALVASGY